MNQRVELAKQASSGNLSIGTVAKLTGISVHTLRAWEKRHNVVSVLRSDTGRRLYRPDDVHRLRLLRRLTQAGHSIGNIASLSDHDLELMLDLEHKDYSENKTESRPRLEVCLFSDKHLENIRLSDNVRRRVDIVQETTEVGELRETLASKRNFSVVMVFGTIQKHQLRLLRQMIESEQRHKYFVVFNFSQREVIDELNTLGFHLVRAPITFDKLFEKVLEASQVQYSSTPGAPAARFAAAEIPPHQFTKRQLERMSGMKSAVECECPQHIAELISALTRFESYCQHCETVNRDDAHMHNEIYKLTAQARSRMERAISIVIEAEKINLNYIASER